MGAGFAVGAVLRVRAGAAAGIGRIHVASSPRMGGNLDNKELTPAPNSISGVFSCLSMPGALFSCGDGLG